MLLRAVAITFLTSILTAKAGSAGLAGELHRKLPLAYEANRGQAPSGVTALVQLPSGRCG